MLTILFIALLLLSGYYHHDFLLKHKKGYIVTSIVLGTLSILFSSFTPTVIINKGFLGLSYFYVVMVVGVMPRNWKLHKRMVPVRQVYSIAGFILITAHIIYYFTLKFTEGTELDPFGILAYLTMIPLFITSFKNMRSFRSFMKWKKLQRLAYLSYIFLFIHLFVTADAPNLYLYIVLFVPYFLVRPYKLFKYDMPHMKHKMKQLNQASQMKRPS